MTGKPPALSDQQAHERIKKILPKFRLYSCFAAVTAAISLAVTEFTSPPDDFRETSEFSARVESLREKFEPVCKGMNIQPGHYYASQSDCVEDMSRDAAENSYYSVPNRAALMLFWLFLVQAIATQIHIRTAERVIREDPKP